tara:strand:+ start:583 stop:969 length:387 start_codon:yes stop_codon:yes gene_type:complete
MGDKRSRLQSRFDAIEKAGGIKLPNMKRGSGVTFTAMERHKATFSVWAFLFGIFYYGYHGVWKKGLSLMAIALVILVLLDTLIVTFFPTIYDAWDSASYVISAVLFATCAPRNLYSKYVLDENGWNPF